MRSKNWYGVVQLEEDTSWTRTVDSLVGPRSEEAFDLRRRTFEVLARSIDPLSVDNAYVLLGASMVYQSQKRVILIVPALSASSAHADYLQPRTSVDVFA